MQITAFSIIKYLNHGEPVRVCWLTQYLAVLQCLEPGLVERIRRSSSPSTLLAAQKAVEQTLEKQRYDRYVKYLEDGEIQEKEKAAEMLKQQLIEKKPSRVKRTVNMDTCSLYIL